MKHLAKIAMAFVALALVGGSALAATDAETVAAFKKAGESAEYFSQAYGYAVFPTIGKGGIGIGAAHGTGSVYQGGKRMGEVTMNQVSVGLQLGGQAYSEIIFFKDKSAYDSFTSGNFEFDAGASVIAIKSSASASAGTTGATSYCGHWQGLADRRFRLLQGHGRVLDCQGWLDVRSHARRPEVQVQAGR